MSNDKNKYLSKMYDKLYNNVEREKSSGVRYDSIIITFMETTKNGVMHFLQESALEDYEIPDSILVELQDKGYIRRANFPDQYTLTAKGVWETEKDFGNLNEEKLIKYLDKKNGYDSFEKVKNLSEKSKVRIFTLISTRAFSEENSLDLKEDERIKNRWKKITEKNYEKLKDLNIIKDLEKGESKKGHLFGNAKAESPIVNLFRHSEKLPRRTKNVFTSSNLSYFLDLLNDDNNINTKKLSFIFWLIFQDNLVDDNGDLKMTEVQEILDFCKKVSRKEGIYLFKNSDYDLSDPSYDEQIKEALIDSVLSRDKWK